MATSVVTVVIAAYLSLLLELSLLHVPSIASSLSIWSPNRAIVAVLSSKYQRLFSLSRPMKLLLFAVPLSVIYAVFLYPPLVLWIGTDPLGDYAFVPVKATDVAGIGCIVFGRLFTMASAMALRRDDDHVGEPADLRTSGPFRWSRNPGLVGMYLFAGGLWLTTPSLGLLAGIVVYVIYMDFKVDMEEDFLRNKLGARYTEYQLRTGRYLP